MTVANILGVKGRSVFSITSQSTVYDSLIAMSDKNIGALLVIDNDNLVGIVSERDYARKIIIKGKSSQETLVKDIMTENPFTITPTDNIETCMSIMSTKKFRHLPVVEDGKVVGMISIGDVVTAIIKSQKETIDYLKDYISQ